jgi:hypothetical protein
MATPTRLFTSCAKPVNTPQQPVPDPRLLQANEALHPRKMRFAGRLLLSPRFRIIHGLLEARSFIRWVRAHFFFWASAFSEVGGWGPVQWKIACEPLPNASA